MMLVHVPVLARNSYRLLQLQLQFITSRIPTIGIPTGRFVLATLMACDASRAVQLDRFFVACVLFIRADRSLMLSNRDTMSFARRDAVVGCFQRHYATERCAAVSSLGPLGKLEHCRH